LFFLATPDDDVLPENITTEAVSADWHSIESILDDAEAERLALIRPTKFLLMDILEQNTIDDLLSRDPVVQPIRGLSAPQKLGEISLETVKAPEWFPVPCCCTY